VTCFRETRLYHRDTGGRHTVLVFSNADGAILQGLKKTAIILFCTADDRRNPGGGGGGKSETKNFFDYINNDSRTCAMNLPSRDKLVGIVTRLRAGRPRNHWSIPGTGVIFFSLIFAQVVGCTQPLI
jgi:hypothetical protein